MYCTFIINITINLCGHISHIEVREAFIRGIAYNKPWPYLASDPIGIRKIQQDNITQL
jgi:hypothetical protein